jgi:hypothetical protein
VVEFVPFAASVRVTTPQNTPEIRASRCAVDRGRYLAHKRPTARPLVQGILPCLARGGLHVESASALRRAAEGFRPSGALERRVAALLGLRSNNSLQLTTPVGRFQRLPCLPSRTSLRPATQAGAAAELRVR